MVMNKRGFMRIIEAVIAILLILSALLLISNRNELRTEKDLTGSISPILEELAQDNELREDIINYNTNENRDYPSNAVILGKINDFVKIRITNPSLDYNVSICNLDSPVCSIEPSPLGNTGDIFAKERVISVNVNEKEFNPKRVKLFLWRKASGERRANQITTLCDGNPKTCSYDGLDCGSFELCVLNCPVPPNEICNDGVDNNCNGEIDEGCSLCGEHQDNGGGSCTAFLDWNYIIVDGDILKLNSGGSVIKRETGQSLDFSKFNEVGINRAYIEWDVTSIPDNANIGNVVLNYFSSINGGGIIKEIKNARPSASSGSAIYNEIGSGISYVSSGFPKEITNWPGQINRIELGASAVNEFSRKLSSNWFAIGMKNTDETTSFSSGWPYISSSDETDNSARPVLEVSYTI